MSDQRLRRIQDLIQRNLALHLRKEVNDPRLTNVVITSVDVSPDLKQAKIYFSIIDPKELNDVTKALNKASSYLRTLLAHSCTLRYTPKLFFIYDNSIEQGYRIDELLNQVPTLSSDEEE